MRITEYEIYAFILGAGAGSIVTYYNMTRDQRAIRAVRREIESYGLQLGVRKVITDGQCKRTYYQSIVAREFVSDERVLDTYRWAQRWVKLPEVKKQKRRPGPETVAAVDIICEELLGLSTNDATRAVFGAKHQDEVVDRLIERKAALKADA
jgi:hypothetical protein